jgi:hypothetical protein
VGILIVLKSINKFSQELPHSVGKDFYCSYNKLTNLSGSPREVSGDFICSDNKLTSLVGSPEFSRWTFLLF